MDLENFNSGMGGRKKELGWAGLGAGRHATPRPDHDSTAFQTDDVYR